MVQGGTETGATAGRRGWTRSLHNLEANPMLTWRDVSCPRVNTVQCFGQDKVTAHEHGGGLADALCMFRDFIVQGPRDSGLLSPTSIQTTRLLLKIPGGQGGYTWS